MRKRFNPFTRQIEDFPPPQTYLCPDGARPDRQSISAALGLLVPPPFVDLVQWIYDEANGDPYRCAEFFNERIGLAVADESFRYESTPCELFPFGHTCVDGDHYGYLVHAPEMPADDYPVCHFCPMDSDGVITKGRGTCDGLMLVMSFWGKSRLHPDHPRWETALKNLPEKFGEEIDVANVISIPRGWRFQPSSDGVGVLAPGALFSSNEVAALDKYGPVEPYLHAAAAALRQGHLATALYYLREGFWFNFSNHPFALCELLCEVYEALNRAGHARTMRAKMAKWREDENEVQGDDE